MLIKKHPNKNDYCLSKSGHWVRDFTKPIIKPFDINEMASIEDMKLALENELKNSLKSYQTIDSEEFYHDKIIIIGDGFGFENNLKLIDELPQDVTIMAVNGAFAKWTSHRRIGYYIINNPYQECLYFYPQIVRIWPKCIASQRSHPTFLENYKGVTYIYSPAKSESYSGVERFDGDSSIDDYRNPICAAINLAFRFKVKKLLLLSTLEMYKEERPGTELVKTGLWMYPQQLIAKALIDANLYWLQKAKIDTRYSDTEPDYEFATYISRGDLKGFFNDK
jgi:hypothetical protein